jgi:hypothetical protein
MNAEGRKGECGIGVSSFILHPFLPLHLPSGKRDFLGMVQFAGLSGDMLPFAPRKWPYFRGAKGDSDGLSLRDSVVSVLP